MEKDIESLELLAPAGDFEKLEFAIYYGADAVYMGGPKFGLRAKAGNFDMEQIQKASEFVHKHGKKIYVTVNIIAHNEDLIDLPEYLLELEKAKVDAIIVSDPGILLISQEVVPDMEIHLSTQANCTNFMAANFWHNQGVKRIVLARELSLVEIKELREKTPLTLDLEGFVHGAMCVSYSGRCLLSSYMTGRDANKGECAHPCRYRYHLVEEKRPNEYYPVEEDDRGTYIFNSKDMSMVRYIPELVQSGITSFKIEGRMKSSSYVAAVVGAYRKAIDAYKKDPENWEFKEEWQIELDKASHREFATGFYFGKMGKEGHNYETSNYVRDYVFVGIVREYDEKTGLAKVEQRNRILKGDRLEIMDPQDETFEIEVVEMFDAEMTPIETAPHPQMTFYIKLDRKVRPMAILRRERKDGE